MHIASFRNVISIENTTNVVFVGFWLVLPLSVLRKVKL